METGSTTDNKRGVDVLLWSVVDVQWWLEKYADNTGVHVTW